MPDRVFSLDEVRTDGWFERIGEEISSFEALCKYVGDRFFAFSVIAGARITALTVDNRNPDQTQVDFVVGPEGAPDLEQQRLSLVDFRRRLVGALLVDERDTTPPPARESDVEAIQLFIGARYLLLAPLYGYSLKTLTLSGGEARVGVLRDGSDESFSLPLFRARIRSHVREELDRISSGNRSAIDLSKVTEAEAFASKGEWSKIVTLLGTWPAPLAIFLRTPEGQSLPSDARALIARGLGLLGTACERLGEFEQAEEMFRLGIQYAQEGFAAADLFRRLGESFMNSKREAEAIAPFRRALDMGGAPKEIYPMLLRAFSARGKLVAAYACAREAMDAGIKESELPAEIHDVEAKLGSTLLAWKAARLSSAR